MEWKAAILAVMSPLSQLVLAPISKLRTSSSENSRILLNKSGAPPEAKNAEDDGFKLPLRIPVATEAYRSTSSVASYSIAALGKTLLISNTPVFDNPAPTTKSVKLPRTKGGSIPRSPPPRASVESVVVFSISSSTYRAPPINLKLSVTSYVSSANAEYCVESMALFCSNN